MAAKKKTAQARIDEDLRGDFDWALEFTGLGETQFLEAAIRALVDEVREKGEITLPLALVPKSQTKQGQSPPGKNPARGGQRTTGLAVPAASITAPTGSTPASRPGVNEEAPLDIDVVAPISPQGSYASKTRLTLRAMAEREKKSKGKK